VDVLSPPKSWVNGSLVKDSPAKNVAPGGLSMNKSRRAMRARRLTRVDGGIRRHHRQQQINERLRSILNGTF